MDVQNATRFARPSACQASGDDVKPITIIVLLIITILLSGFVGVRTNYQLNKLLQVSHSSTYSKEEEFRLYDQMLKMASNNEISQADVIRIVENQKKQRTAAYDITEGAQEISTSMNATLIVLIILQIALLIYYVKKANA